MNGEDQTKGSGAVLADGWRNFSHLISFPEITVEMIDSSPPETLIEDLFEEKFLLVDEVEGLLVNEGGYFICGEVILFPRRRSLNKNYSNFEPKSNKE